MIAFPISLKSTKVIPRETFITRPFATKSKAPDVFFEEKNLSESVVPLFSIPYFLTKKDITEKINADVIGNGKGAPNLTTHHKDYSFSTCAKFRISAKFPGKLTFLTP